MPIPAAHQHLRTQLTAVQRDHGQWAALLTAMHDHFAEEEASAFTLASRAGWTGGTAVHEFRYQHHALWEEAQSVNQLLEINDPKLEPALQAFGQRLEEHLGAEEMVLYPLLSP